MTTVEAKVNCLNQSDEELQMLVQKDPDNLQIGTCPEHGSVLKVRNPNNGYFDYSCAPLHVRIGHLNDQPPGRGMGIDR